MRRIGRNGIAVASTLTLGLALGFATTAAAVDGVIEINSAKVAAGGVTAADTPGYPVTISKSGSYVLTSNLAATLTFGTDFIDVTTDDVTIDMNGFVLECITLVVGGPPIPCTLSSGNGIDGGQNRGLTVLNGTVKWMGNDGIVAGDGARLEGIHLIENDRYGAFLGEGAVVRQAEAWGNGDTGLRISAGSTVSHSAIYKNGKGVIGVGGVLLVQNSIHANSSFGVSSLNGGDVAMGLNTLYGNNGNGAETDGSIFQVGSNQCGAGFCP